MKVSFANFESQKHSEYTTGAGRTGIVRVPSFLFFFSPSGGESVVPIRTRLLLHVCSGSSHTTIGVDAESRTMPPVNHAEKNTIHHLFAFDWLACVSAVNALSCLCGIVIGEAIVAKQKTPVKSVTKSYYRHRNDGVFTRKDRKLT